MFKLKQTIPMHGTIAQVGHGETAANDSTFSRVKTAVVGLSFAFASAMAHAAADTSAITDAGATAALYAAAIGGVLATIWGLKLAYRKFFGG